MARALQKEDWINHEKFKSAKSRAINAAALIHELNMSIGGLSVAQIEERFAKHDVWWQPSHTALEALQDKQVLAVNSIIEIPVNASDNQAGLKGIPSLRGPVNFSNSDYTPRPVPELGEHTHAVLRDAGIPETQLNDLTFQHKSKL